MSTESKLKGKGGKAPASANNAGDSIMPLLLAAIGNPAINFKKMAAMDELGRTESSFEHKFRKWRQKGREIAASNPEHAGSLGTSNGVAATTKKPHAPAKMGVNGRGKGAITQDDAENEEDEEDKDGADETGDIGGEKPHPSVKGKTTAANNTKKRAASFQTAVADQEVGKEPTKKAKVAKKGTAKVVKKHKAKVYYSSSEEEDKEREVEEIVSTKPTGKGKGNVAAASGKAKAVAQPTGSRKAKKEKAFTAAKAGQNINQEDEDTDCGDGHHDGMVDMQFDQIA